MDIRFALSIVQIEPELVLNSCVLYSCGCMVVCMCGGEWGWCGEVNIKAISASNYVGVEAEHGNYIFLFCSANLNWDLH